MASKVIFVSNQSEVKWVYILQRVSIGLIYPFIIVVLVSIINEFSFYRFLLASGIVIAPFLLFISIYVLFRCAYSLKEISFDSEKKIITIAYYKFSIYKEVSIDNGDLEVTFMRDPTTLFEYYVLKFNVRGSLLFRQFQENGWEKETFIELVKALESHKIECKYLFFLKKIIYED
ncbi:MAG: hypothetical protein JST90_03505 [Bacteroidetes bacterium]|nr:hypothetical protein [Bacteroidota bacterium]